MHQSLVEHVGKVPFECPQRLHRRPAFGETTPVVGATGCVVAQLYDGHDVQDPVDAPVARPGQPVAFLVAGGCLDWGGAVPRGEVRCGTESADVTDVTDEAGRTGRADPVEIEQGTAGGGYELA
jgi:hypothetical protein